MTDGSYAVAASYIPDLGYDAVSRIIRENGGDAAKVRAALAAAAEQKGEQAGVAAVGDKDINEIRMGLLSVCA